MGISNTIVSAAIAATLNTGYFPTTSVSDKDMACMTEAIFFEASNSPRHVKDSVANVVMNRLQSNKFPNSICSITYQKGQFSYQRPDKNKFVTKHQSGNINESAQVALEALSGRLKDNTNGALYFINPAVATNTAWLAKKKRVKIIGPHHFYK